MNTSAHYNPSEEANSSPSAPSRKRGSTVHNKNNSKTHSIIQWLLTVIATILVVLLLIFAVQNVQYTRITFLIWGFYLPLSITLILTFAIGIAIGSLISLRRTWHLHRVIDNLTKNFKKSS